MNRETLIALGVALLVAGGCRGTEQADVRTETDRAVQTPGDEPGAPVTVTEAGQLAGTDADAGVGPSPGAPGAVTGGGQNGNPGAAASASGVPPQAPAGAAAAAPPAATETAPDAAAVLRRAEEVYSGIRAMEADFRQVVEVPLLGQTTRSQGKIYHRRPDRFAMHFTQPQGDVVVADGRHLWMYYPSVDARQVMRTGMSAAAGQQMDLHAEFLSNPTARYNAVLQGVESVGGRPAHVVHLTPRTRSGYRHVRIWIDREDALVRRFELTEENESVRTLELSNIRRNPTLADNLFQFTPPAGAQVFDQ
jgi:outer membrane lipoprotein carrier protein